MKKSEQFHDLIHKSIGSLNFQGKPEELYLPVQYALTMGGKRIRPLLTLLSCDMFGGKPESALPAAMALEVFHNFTLVHDDIMDKAPLRRGRETVYKKWNTNIGILSGDAMLAQAFMLLLDSEPAHLKPLVALLGEVALRVCEGQQLDMNYEQTEKVSIPEYLDMIRLKTAVLAGTCMDAGAIVAGAGTRDRKNAYLFGEHLGMAFQLKDDILDVFGDEAKFGKKKGGDIISKKKTYLYLKAHELAKGKTLNSLIYYFVNSTFDDDTKIAAVSDIYKQLRVMDYAEKQMTVYYKKAMLCLASISLPEKNKKSLTGLAEQLMVREF